MLNFVAGTALFRRADSAAGTAPSGMAHRYRDRRSTLEGCALNSVACRDFEKVVCRFCGRGRAWR